MPRRGFRRFVQLHAARALPFVLLAAVALMAMAVRNEADPGRLAAATPVPDAALKQSCIDGAAVGSGNDGLASDCALLLEAKDTLRGGETLNWSASLAIASWEGITTAGTPSRVTKLEIDGANSARRIGREITLNGSVPAALGGLSKLERLQLSRNELTGTIPPELGNLAELTVLQLYSNQLTGGIPPELGSLSSLSTLNLRDNALGGSIPVELGRLSNLAALYLERSGLTGSIPASLGDLSELVILQLARNTMLSGCIPASLRDISLSDLGSLDLAYCTTTTTYALTTEAGADGRISPLPGTYSYLDGSSVTVTATPAAGWQIASWGGDCSGMATTCALTMSADRTASVTFERVPLTLTVTAGAGGTVAHDGGAAIYDGDEVTLTASWNDATHDFGGWGGDCSTVGTTSSTCVLMVDADKAVTATFTELSATRCSNTNDANCIRAVYIGKPGDYRQVVDIPPAMRLSAGPGGTYHVDAGLEVTVVTAARLPSGWTRFYLDRDPLGDPPISFSQLIPPVGTTYTFTVSDDAAEATDITYELKQAKPFVRPRPDGKPHIGATVVETDFQVQDCSSGIAVTNPQTNTELVGDCESLLGLRDTIRGDAALNWTAGKAMSDWMGVTVSGTPQRVTTLDLSDLSLDGELSGLLGNLTGLATLDLSGNELTGLLPSKLGQLTSLTSVTLDGTTFDGCAPPVLNKAATNDVDLDDCAAPTRISSDRTTPVPAGTYMVGGGTTGWPVTVFDVPAGTAFTKITMIHANINMRPGHARPNKGTAGYVLSDDAETFRWGIDMHFGREWTCTSTSAQQADLCKRMTESLWEGAD